MSIITRMQHSVKRLAGTRAGVIQSLKQRCTAAFSSAAQKSAPLHGSKSATRWLAVAAAGTTASALWYFTHPDDDSSLHAYTGIPEIFPGPEGLSADIWSPPAFPVSEWKTNWDGLDAVPVQIDAATGRPIHVTRHLIFIRHGQYVLPNKETKEFDPVLTKLGREQARITGQRLKSLGYEIDAIHCSTMMRAFETASLIRESFPDTPLYATDLLREGVPCAHAPQHPTWKPDEEEMRTEPVRIKKGFESIVKRWRVNEEGKQIHSQQQYENEQKAVKEKDSASAATATSDANDKQSTKKGKDEKADTNNSKKDNPKALASSSSGTVSVPADASSAVGATKKSGEQLKPIHKDRYELVVCHGNVIRYSLLRALQLPVQAWLRIAIFNTGISHIYVRYNGNVGLEKLGDTGHLSKEQITYF